MAFYINQNNSTIVDKEKHCTIINGFSYPWRKGMKGKKVKVVNNRVFIDGYELRYYGVWKRTLRALFYLWF